ncbi:MAG: tRNA (N(6)-L-threonylcarbamoyladenosine(37)-C(2))-methylthiotransferase MtaB [Oscillospiraceae bacterium]
MVNIFLYTFGCKVNSFETAAMSELLVKKGYQIATSDSDADVIVINSCTVTANGDKRVRQYLRRVKRLNPQVITVLSGCFPQAFPEQASEFTEADIIMGTGNRNELPDLLSNFITDRKSRISIAPNSGKTFEILKTENLDGHTRAFLKIEDGCERFCAYCIVPFARGPVRSMPLDRLMEQLKMFADNGYKEIVLSGINLSCYGRGTEHNLADAIECAADIDGIERIRLGSLEPDLLSDDMLHRMSRVKKLCPQFHLALQSGCDATLKRMNRKYSISQYVEVSQKIKGMFISPTFTTDVMVGFAGETDDDFDASLKFVSEFGFLKCHIFPYSIRSGTAGAKMPCQIDKYVKDKRAALMSEAAQKSRVKVMQEFVGKPARVILETMQDDGAYSGYTDRYLPALVYGRGLHKHDIVEGIISDLRGDHCVIRLGQ